MSGGAMAQGKESRWLLPAAVVTVLGVAVLVFGRELELPWLGLVSKMTASTGFLVMAWAAGAFRSGYGIAVFVGLFFSWWGDLFLALPGTFLFGLVAFLLGHVGYAVAFVVHGVRWPVAAGALAVAAVPVYFIFQWLNPHLPDDMRIPVYAYMTVITLMVALSFGAWKKGGVWLMPLAAVMFWVSDLFVARGRFVEQDMWNGLIGLPLYFGGQMVFAWSIKSLRDAKLHRGV